MGARLPDLSNEATLEQRCELMRLCCALCAADGPDARRLCTDRENPLDWRALVAAATAFRLGLLLHRAVDAHLADIADPAAVAALREVYAANQARSRVLTAELREVLDRLAAAQLPIIAYKGPAFAAQLYGDVALRGYIDLDVLILERDLPAVTRVMEDAGYRAGMSLSWEVSFERAGGEVASEGIDLHWSITEAIHQFPWTADELWARRSSVSLAGRPAAVLCAEDMLLTLCFNALTENWQRFDRIADVAALVRQETGIDWAALLERCRRRGCERIVLTGLHLAKGLFLVTLPEAVEQRLRAHQRAIVAAGYGLDDFIVFAVASTTRLQGYEAWRFLFRMREGLRERIPYAQSMAYAFLKPQADDAPWQRLSRRGLYALIRLPLLGVKRGLRAIGMYTQER